MTNAYPRCLNRDLRKFVTLAGRILRVLNLIQLLQFDPPSRSNENSFLLPAFLVFIVAQTIPHQMLAEQAVAAQSAETVLLQKLLHPYQVCRGLVWCVRSVGVAS